MFAECVTRKDLKEKITERAECIWRPAGTSAQRRFRRNAELIWSRELFMDAGFFCLCRLLFFDRRLRCGQARDRNAER